MAGATRGSAPKPEPDSVSRFTIDGKPYEIDMARLTWGEVVGFEEWFGVAYDEIDFESGKATAYTAYLALKRKKPDATLDEILALPVDRIEAREPAPPKPSKPSSARKPASKPRTRSTAEAKP